MLSLDLGLGRELKILLGLGLNPRTETEHRAVSVHLQACLQEDVLKDGFHHFYINPHGFAKYTANNLKKMINDYCKRNEGLERVKTENSDDDMF